MNPKNFLLLSLTITVSFYLGWFLKPTTFKQNYKFKRDKLSFTMDWSLLVNKESDLYNHLKLDSSTNTLILVLAHQ